MSMGEMKLHPDPPADKPKYHITNIVYGDTYSRLFLENHLKSVLDETNLPEVSKDYDITYNIITDAKTQPTLEAHANVKRLQSQVRVVFSPINWPDDQHFARRYEVIVQGFGHAIRAALMEGALFTPLVADYVVAKGFFPCLTKRIKEGHDAVLMLPPRCSAETASQVLSQIEGALPPLDLFKICFDHLHSLWRDSYWNTPRFTSIPFVLLWGSERGLLVRTFSLSPLIFRPTERMLRAEGVIDRELPALCENPFFATDWTDAPVVNVEPALCYLGWFGSGPANPKIVGEWAKSSLHLTQKGWPKKIFHYPNAKECGVSGTEIANSEKVLSEVEKWFQ